MRPAVDDIIAPPFPRGLPWINTAALRMDQQRGRPVLVEFIDHCRPESLRSLPYLQRLHERYAEAGLRVIAVHTSGFGPVPRRPDPHSDDESPAAADPDGEALAEALEPLAGAAAVAGAMERLGVTAPVVVDLHYDIWELYGNRGWPARFLWDAEGVLVDAHRESRGHADTERAVMEQLGRDGDPQPPLRPEDDDAATLGPIVPGNQEGAWSGEYEAGAVWAVLQGPGEIEVNGRRRTVEYDGCHLLVEHERHTAATLAFDLGAGVGCHATLLTPGAAAPA